MVSFRIFFLSSGFCLLVVGTLSAQVESYEKRIRNLRSDSVSFNASEAIHSLMQTLDQGANPTPVSQLEDVLDSRDYQQRQIATWLLVEYHYRRNRVPEKEWPPTAIRNLVEGLKDDDLHFGRTIPNASDFLMDLYAMKENRPISRLRKLLDGTDPQGQFCAAALLAKFQPNTVQPEVSRVLMTHLRRDRLFENEIVACRSLMELGRKNFKKIFNSAVRDVQQAAYCRFLCSYFGVDWKPNPSMVDEWFRAASDPYPSKIYLAALYVTPNADEYLKGKEIPAGLQTVLEKGPHTQNIRKRARWARNWFYLLSPARYEGESLQDPLADCAWCAVLMWDPEYRFVP